MSTVEPAEWHGCRVLLTGDTGFKGAWLATWLQVLGADVCGFALAPPSTPNLYDQLGLAHRGRHVRGDIRDAAALADAFATHAPEIVFHLAAQPLVRAAYRDPVATWTTNVLGTVRVLEAVRACPAVRVVVVITTDKVYENRELGVPFAEDAPLGGHDPYSASKAAAELACSAWRRSFLAERGTALATARAGNVLGGGDWAEDRIVPDAIRAFSGGRAVRVRNPDATRPWQHVLEPLRGYLLLAQACRRDPARFARAYNFGPAPADCVPVRRVLDGLVRRWGDGAAWEPDGAPHPHEAGRLSLDWSRARTDLGWTPRVDLERCLDLTVEWYRVQRAGADVAALTRAQIAAAGA